MLCSIQDASKVFKLSQRHIRRMIADGRWPVYRLGRRLVRLDLEEIKAATGPFHGGPRGPMWKRGFGRNDAWKQNDGS